MSEPYYAAAYWGDRPESAEVCARRAALFFQTLSMCHSSYGCWYEHSRPTRKAPPLPFEPTAETFVRFFGQKKHQAGRDGFSFSAWTGHPENQGGMVLIACGASAQDATNLAQLYLPSEPPGWDQLVTLPVLSCVIRALVRAWEPDWAVATPRELRERLSPTGLPGTFTGWLTYYGRQWGAVPVLPAPAQVESIDELGSLVTLTPERLSEANPEHVALGLRVQQVLAQHGLLRPVAGP